MPEPQNNDNLTFEEAFSKLESIVEALENSSMTLEESLALYERGQSLAKYCADVLDKAELKVKILSGQLDEDFESGK